MRTDKQVYLIFRAQPELAFELADLPSPGPCRMESTTFKELERTTDGLIVPESADEPVTVLEVQFYEDAAIYNRTATMMALAQQPRLPQPVQGLVFFASRTLDPRTQPWDRIIHPVYLDEALRSLQATAPLHPLVAVFAPVFIETVQELETNAKHYYHALGEAPVPDDVRHTLLRVFCDWLFERFKHLSRKEITMILDLPDVRDTIVGRELLEEGIEKGIEKGLEKGIERGQRKAWLDMVNQIGKKRLGPLNSDLQDRISRLDDPTLHGLVDAMFDLPTWQAVKAWLDAR